MTAKKKKSVGICALLFLIILTTSCGNAGNKTNTKKTNSEKTVTFTGILQDEDCFVQYVDPKTGIAKEDPGDDTKTCLLMNACAGSGYGIIVKQKNGKYKYYYFDGEFATGNKQTFKPGTGPQLTSWQIAQNTKKEDHVTVTVKGVLKGNKRKNTNVTFAANRDGIDYPVIKVTSITEN